MGTYPFDNTWAQERQRLTSITQTCDPGTIEHLMMLGVNEGWQCLEIGAGTGSIAQWLCKSVGDSGHVVATDINMHYLNELKERNLEILHHDITMDNLPEKIFDLVHSRLLLDVLPERDVVLDRMLFALKPGGWLVVEEFDGVTSVPDPSIGTTATELFSKIQNAMQLLWAQQGFDSEYGRKLLTQLRKRGLEKLGGQGRAFIRQGGSQGSKAWRLSIEQLRSAFVSFGFATEMEINDMLMLLDDPTLTYLSPLMVTVWGQRLK